MAALAYYDRLRHTWLQKSSAGDAAVAQTRLQLLSDISLVQVNLDCVSLARALVERGPIPEKAAR